MKLSKPKCIELIVEEIKIGTTFEECFKLIKTKSNLVRSTFASYWNIAQEQHKKAQQEVNEQSRIHNVGNEIEARKTALKEQIERLKILKDKFSELAKIKKGKVAYKDKEGNVEIFTITIGDEVRAIETMIKIDTRLGIAEGTDKPTKIAPTDSDGNDLLPRFAGVLISDKEYSSLRSPKENERDDWA